ncbi:hypothetical protein BH23GEM9_BH23GEM9_28600 [soil metagenome]
MRRSESSQIRANTPTGSHSLSEVPSTDLVMERRAWPRGSGREPLSPRTRRLARWMFNGHLWLGVIVSGLLLVISISGILLNHKRGLGLMPDVPHQATAEFEAALPMAELVRLAREAAPEAGAAGVDRLDVRPRTGIMKVRLRDDVVTEVTLDIHDGRVLHVGQRNDVFLEKLHSGEIFGDNWVLLSDFAAVVLVILIISGYWLWLFPRSRH